MPVQITIIGLGQTGASIGLALAAHKDLISVTGHDKDYSAETRAKKIGAVDTTNHNLQQKNSLMAALYLAVTHIHTIHNCVSIWKKGIAVSTRLSTSKEKRKKSCGLILLPVPELWDNHTFTGATINYSSYRFPISRLPNVGQTVPDFPTR